MNGDNKRWIVVKWTTTPANPAFPPTEERALVVYDPLFPERMYWWLGGGYCFWPKTVEIIDEYDTEEDEDTVYLQYLRKYHKPVKATLLGDVRYGWISPTGDIYSCSYAEHGDTAKKVCASLYNLLSWDAEIELEDRGWLKLTATGIVITHETRATRAQCDAILDLALAAEKTDFGSVLMDDLETLEDIHV